MFDLDSIEVYCDDASTRSGMHGGRDVKVITFERVVDLPASAERDHHRWGVRPAPTVQQWRDYDADVAESWPLATRQPGDRPSGPIEFWRTQKYAPPVRETWVDQDGNVHDNSSGAGSKFVMHCSLCGLNIQRRNRNLTPVLDQLYAAGIERMSLVSLGAMVASSKNE